VKSWSYFVDKKAKIDFLTQIPLPLIIIIPFRGVKTIDWDFSQPSFMEEFQWLEPRAKREKR
jgi:hypothetical protein